MARTNIAVVGGGLGGLTAGLALDAMGFDVTIFEQASQLKEVGAGVQLSPNAVQVFRALKLEEAVLASAFEPDRHVVRNWQTGREISATPLKGVLAQNFGAGYYGFHRADLHSVLASALPQSCLELGARCIGIESDANGALLRFADGKTFATNAVVAADGIHSQIADILYGAQSPRFTGNICWRGLVPTSALPQALISPDMNVYFGPEAHVVTYYVRGGDYVNWFACRMQDDWRLESWSQEVDRDEVLQAYQGWSPTLLELFAKSERCYKWALFDRDPRKKWSSDCVTLLGDAAHPMLPTLAQGACMAIEDAYAVAACLAQDKKNPKTAFEAYEALRRPRTSRIQMLARARAEANQLASGRRSFFRDLKYALARRLRPTKHTYGIEWIYAYDVVAASKPTM